ncbi:methyltransferase family protein [Crassaminicella profunda]|uniref:methyltransferase family protein n=1 Tax=Crassaminicella profunda TaxID=1286698 RepID=UPI001CA6E098|nr:isoprenylcysteine carboxylmethyltransferase family protein [Crassaminicella profunda]QZY53774.1 isoprenylcysteine carboxylmethyltransferase family protein [Crassaminicella profunda]
MSNKNYFYWFLEMKPNVRVLIQEVLLIGSGIVGLVFNFSKIPFSPYRDIVGVVLIAYAIYIHVCSEKTLKQAHDKPEDIKEVVRTGIYKKIRHPIYLSLIIMDIGIMLSFGILWMMPLVIIFSYFHLMTAIQEEKLLIKKFNGEYKEYMKEVPYKMIPKMF